MRDFLYRESSTKDIGIVSMAANITIDKRAPGNALVVFMAYRLICSNLLFFGRNEEAF